MGAGAAAVVGDGAAFHDQQIVGLQGHAQLMQHADHGAARGHVGAHHAQPVGLVGRVEVRQGFVHQPDGRLHGQQARQQHALTFAARQGAQAPVAQRPDLRGLQRRAGGGVVGGGRRRQPGAVRQPPQQRHVVGTQVFGTGFGLAQPGQLAGAFARRPLPQRPPGQRDGPLRVQQAGQHAKQGGFARAVGPDDGRPAACGQRQRQGPQYGMISDAGARRMGANSYVFRSIQGHDCPARVRRYISHSR